MSDVESPRIKWAAEVSPVREVSLLGTADLGYWTERLAREDLAPVQRDGRAQVLVMSGAMRFMGLHFRELSFSVFVEGGAFLLHAFNSSRLFAFSERMFFSTPYEHGDVRVLPSGIHLARRGVFPFRGEFDPHRAPDRTGEEGWEGTAFLPSTGRGKRRKFFARVRGETRAYAFCPGEDTLEIGTESPALRALADSGFAGLEWSVRDEALHAKSKTYPREWAPDPDRR